MLYPHHQRTVERLIDRFQVDPNFLALLIGGSLVKGYGNEGSDVDFMLIATDEEFARRSADRALTYYATDLCDYPGGYVDGKIVNVAFLEEVADRGSEPARSAFENVIVAYSQLPQLDDLLERITAYPETTHTAKLQSFYAQLLAHAVVRGRSGEARQSLSDDAHRVGVGVVWRADAAGTQSHAVSVSQVVLAPLAGCA